MRKNEDKPAPRAQTREQASMPSGRPLRLALFVAYAQPCAPRRDTASEAWEVVRVLDRIWWAIQAAQPWKEYDLGRLNPVQLEKMESKFMELREDTVVEQPRTVQFVDKPKLRPLIARAFEEMGIRGEPIGAEKVQEMIAACGVRLEDNIFSQGIIEMREE